jgi:hypothetical protein
VENLQTGEWLPLPRTPLDEFIAQVAELFWRLLAGFLNGLAPGYVSHLVLDGSIGSRGIPLLFGRMVIKG